MDSGITLIALVEIISSLTTGIAILWFTYRGFQRFGRRNFGMSAENNVSYSILMASILFSVGLSVSTVIQPLISAFRIMNEAASGDLELVGRFILYGGLYVFIAYITSLAITATGIYIYVNLTPLNEFEEIKNNNTGVAIVLSSIVITLNLISKSGVALLIESIIPYPTLPPIG